MDVALADLDDYSDEDDYYAAYSQVIRLLPSYFEGGSAEPGVIDNRQWLNAILNGTEPLVKPEQALVVTQVLDAIYKAAATGKEVRF